ncbi:hypothetical protein SAMN05421823_101669 [Catalinimonas alkaloidigena]|uniref:YXWGXW repeat-containing protein n=1 Tax=Catalinimonas alkaloidigena TaxID=1075417 RepID=A0A1G8YGB3_9BACT|nr:DUF6600 domain-containing protein [Catalinimonas alkaloidigena]SDK01959.1 hypothetical protein SAMN05421823_101669 [Catalinimonas alkaloidigena]
MNIIRTLGAVALLAVLSTGCTSARTVTTTRTVTTAQPVGNVSYQMFYDQLSPYGRWINDPVYGYVWSPYVDAGFAPYATNGYWVMTSYGNTWVSNYSWGWAPFHYGRWYYDNFYGWLWMPGDVWGPAWVSWRNGGGYYGWAPLGPGMAPGVHININVGYWNFLPYRYITHRNPYRYCVPRRRVTNIYNNTTIINNYYNDGGRRYAAGPRAGDIQRSTGQRVRVYDVSRDGAPGRTVVRNNSVNIYRPDVAARGNAKPSRAVTPTTTGARGSRGNDANTSGTPSRGQMQPAPSRSVERSTYERSPSPERQASPAPSRSSRSVERVQPQQQRSTERSTPTPQRQYSPSPSRSVEHSAPQRSVERQSAPSRSMERSAPAPQRSVERQSAPSRSSTPSRSFERSAPSRSSTPSRSIERSAPSRSSTPSRSIERSAPSRSSTPSRSIQRSSSPSRSRDSQ